GREPQEWARRALGARLGNLVEEDLEPGGGLLDAELGQDAGMELAERRQRLGAELQGARATGMEPGGRVGGDLQVLGRRARGFQRRERIGLSEEDVDRRAGIGPVARSAAAEAQTGGDE